MPSVDVPIQTWPIACVAKIRFVGFAAKWINGPGGTRYMDDDVAQTCPSKHAVPDGQRYCGTCGAQVGLPAVPPVSEPSRGAAASRSLLLAGIGVVVATLIGVAYVAERVGADADTAIAEASESLPQSPPIEEPLQAQEQCERDTILILTAQLQDFAAGHHNVGGPGSAYVASEYGVASDEAAFASNLLHVVVRVYIEEGAEAAGASVVATAQEACADLYGTAIPSASPSGDMEASEQAVPSTPSPEPECTLGVSACQFDNGIDFENLRADIGREFAVEPTAVSCDLAPMPPSSAPVGETFYCATDETMYPTVAVTVLEDAPHYVVAPAPPLGD